MASELLANNFAVQLASGCAQTDTTITVTAAAPTALQSGQFRVLIDQEYMLVTSGASTTTWNVTRGAGTGEPVTPTQVSHQSGSWVTHVLTAGALFGGNLGSVALVRSSAGSTQTLPHVIGPTSTGGDDGAAINTAIANTPEGSTLWLPSSAYLTSVQINVNRRINLMGSWGRTNAGTSIGTIISPTNSTVQGSLASIVAVTNSYANLHDLAIVGTGAGNGGAGLVISGSSGTHTHNTRYFRVQTRDFAYGIKCGAYSDHAYFYDCESTENTHGVLFDVNNQNDYLFEGCDLTGNTTSSLDLAANQSVTNVVCLRTHLGFCTDGIRQETTTTGDGFSGLILVGCPIESISGHHINVYNINGPVDIIGGYWHWNGTPSNPAMVVTGAGGGGVNGPIHIGCSFVNANANSPAVVNVGSYTSYSIRIDQDPGSFAQARYSGNGLQGTTNVTGFVSFTGKRASTVSLLKGIWVFTAGSGSGITQIAYSTDNGVHYTNLLSQASGPVPAGANLTVGPLPPEALILQTFSTTQATTTFVPVTD